MWVYRFEVSRTLLVVCHDNDLSALRVAWIWFCRLQQLYGVRSFQSQLGHNQPSYSSDVEQRAKRDSVPTTTALGGLEQ